MLEYCENCGSRQYDGHCTWCHEETYIAEQSWDNDEPTAFSESFIDKLKTQSKEAKRILDKEGVK